MKKSANWWLALPKNKPRKLFGVMKLPFLMCVFFATSVSGRGLGTATVDYAVG